MSDEQAPIPSQAAGRPAREQRGERKRKRILATRARHAAHAAQQSALQRAPESAEEAGRRWDLFYESKPTLFKDRHLLRSALPDVVDSAVACNPRAHIPPLHVAAPFATPSCAPGAATAGNDILFLLEAGCGSGSTFYPLLRANPRLHALAFDLSATAVAVARASPEFSAARVTLFQADASRADSFVPRVRAATGGVGAHFATAIWTLSALPRAARAAAAAALAAALRDDGGLLFVRDYARGDMREARFAATGRRVGADGAVGDGVSNGGRLFLRGDGTYAYFFDVEELRALFTDCAGLTCNYCHYEEREVHNRKEGLVMRRRWVVAKFRKGVLDDEEQTSETLKASTK